VARLIHPGTPSRTRRYVFPSGRHGVVVLSLVGGLCLAAALGYASATRFRAAASPGPVASAHARFEEKCAVCHQPQATSAKCEACHDPFGTGRYENAAHVRFANPDPPRSGEPVWLECTECHGDHRGRQFAIAKTDERDCRTCHFPSMAEHPEFALVRARVQRDEGMILSHKRHLKETRKSKLHDCEYCHEPTRDGSGFEPLSFDRHCAECHLKKGNLGPTDPIPAAAVVLPQQMDSATAQGRRAQPDAAGNVVVGPLTHKDPWVLANLARISSELDPEGFARKRAELEARASDLKAQSKLSAKAAPKTDLAAERVRLSGRLASLPSDPSRLAERRSLEREFALVALQEQLGALPAAARAPRGRRQLDLDLAATKSQIEFMDLAADARSSLSAEERELRRAAVAPLTAACTLCHVYKGTLPEPVRAAIPVLIRANYVHRPHLQLVGCVKCHSGIEESRKAEDVNLPGVAVCAECHRAGRSRSDCAECHTFHPHERR
jgi:hypothetical protein